MRRKKSKRGIIDEDIPEVSEANAKRQVIYGGTGFVVSLTLVLLFRPGTEYLLEMIVMIGVVASVTWFGMKVADWVDSKEFNLKG